MNDLGWRRIIAGYNGSCEVFFECPECFAMTQYPEGHLSWHILIVPSRTTTHILNGIDAHVRQHHPETSPR